MHDLDPDAFVARTANGWAVRMDTSIYEEFDYDCACGVRHRYGEGVGRAIRELSGMRFVVPCASAEEVMNCVKVKGFPMSTGLETLFSTVGPPGFVQEYVLACGRDEAARRDATTVKRRNTVVGVGFIAAGLLLANTTDSSVLLIVGWLMAGFGALGLFGSMGRSG